MFCLPRLHDYMYFSKLTKYTHEMNISFYVKYHLNKKYYHMCMIILYASQLLRKQKSMKSTKFPNLFFSVV